MQVQINALKQVVEVENAVTAPLEDLDPVVQASHKAAILALNEIVRDFFPPLLKQIQEAIKTVACTVLDLSDPAQDFGLGLFLR